MRHVGSGAVVAASLALVLTHAVAGATHSGVSPRNPPLTGATAISMGSQSGCAIVGGTIATPNGHVDCWGVDTKGELGDGPTSYPAPSHFAVQVVGISTAKQLSVGAATACAIVATTGTNLKCWGDNDLGEASNAAHSPEQALVPVTAGLVVGATQVSVGEAEVCTIVGGTIASPNGGVECWGNNDDGQLGNSTNGGVRSAPAAVTGLSAGVREIATDADDVGACALKGNGTVVCWGDNTSGQDGANPSTAYFDSPHLVPGIAGARAITMGDNNACAILGGSFASPLGSVKCWGSDAYSELGNHSWNAWAPTPVWMRAGVAPTPHVTAVIQVGEDDTGCTLFAAGTLKCVGDGQEGEIGDNTWQTSHVPVWVRAGATPTPHLSAIRRISDGTNVICALRSNGNVWCWGWGNDGRLGNNHSSNRSVPQRVVL
jgi:alpha-tubulin suppressor-like RCC1 family protein